MLHPDASSPLICSAGRTGFYIDAVGHYWKATAEGIDTFYDSAFVHIDLTRVGDLGAPAGTKGPDRAQLERIAREIFARCDKVVFRIAGPMDPLTNPDILAFFEACKAQLHKVQEIRLMTNLGIEQTFETILGMGFGPKLHSTVSLHVEDDNFDPFRIVRQIRRAQAAGTVIGCHIVPSSMGRELMVDYLDFFSLHGVQVRLAPSITDDPAGRPLVKGTQQPGHLPRHHRAMKDFLGEDFAGRVPGQSYAAYVEQIRSLNADAYEVLDAVRRKVFTPHAEPRPASAMPSKPPTASNGVHDLRRQALAAHAAGATDRAIALLQQALQHSARDPEVLCDLATLALATGDVVAAVKLARATLEQAPDHAVASYTLGMALAQGGAAAPAIRALERVAAGDGAAALRAQTGALADNVAPMLERLRQQQAA